jgi:hypothetical protein
MGATILLWTDRHVATITLVSVDKKRVWVAQDRAIRADNRGYYTENQEYRYERNWEAEQACYTLRKHGRWVRRGEDMWTGQAILIGHREEYRDPSFSYQANAMRGPFKRLKQLVPSIFGEKHKVVDLDVPEGCNVIVVCTTDSSRDYRRPCAVSPPPRQ